MKDEQATWPQASLDKCLKHVPTAQDSPLRPYRRCHRHNGRGSLVWRRSQDATGNEKGIIPSCCLLLNFWHPTLPNRDPYLSLTAVLKCRKSKPDLKLRRRRKSRSWRKCVGRWWRRGSGWSGRFRDWVVRGQREVRRKVQLEGREGEGLLPDGHSAASTGYWR